MNIIDSFLYYNLNITDYNSRWAVIIFATICFICLVLRVVIFSSYKIAYSGFLLFSKEINKKEIDPREAKPGLSSLTFKIIRDYVSIGERKPGAINAKSIIDARIMKIGLPGMSFISLGEFVDKFEQSSVFIALILALVFEDTETIASAGLGAYIILRFFAALFDFKLAKESLANSITAFIEREIGQYYTSDAAGAIDRFKIELRASISDIGQYFERAMADLCKNLDKSIVSGMNDIANSVNFTMESLSKYNEFMEEPFQKWRSTVEESVLAQAALCEGIEKMTSNTTNYGKIQKSIEINISTLTMALDDQAQNIKSASKLLERAVQDYSDKQENLKEIFNSVNEQMKAFAENQGHIESAMLKYEESLKKITAELSNGAGSIIGVHVQNAYNDLNDILKNNINTITNSNAHLIKLLEGFTEEIIRIDRTIEKRSV